MCKRTLYHAFILSNFNDFLEHVVFVEKLKPQTGKSPITKTPYEDLLACSKLPSLNIRRLRNFAIKIYKITNKHPHSYIHLQISQHSRSRHTTNKSHKISKKKKPVSVRSEFPTISLQNKNCLLRVQQIICILIKTTKISGIVNL